MQLKHIIAQRYLLHDIVSKRAISLKSHNQEFETIFVNVSPKKVQG
jgi:hypothetical protein